MPAPRVATVGRDGTRMGSFGSGGYRFSRPIWTGAIYEAKPRKKDGVVTWRRVGSFGGTVCSSRPSTKFVARLKATSKYHWLLGIRHGNVVEVSDGIPKFTANGTVLRSRRTA